MSENLVHGPHLAGRDVAVNADDNPFKLVARFRKARACAKVLLAQGASASDAEYLDGEVARKLTATIAGVNVPSVTTWALVIEMVREVRPE